MRVVICGAGRVGQGIARRLSRERHDVVIVDEDERLVERVSAELDVRGIVGHAAHPDVLETARTGDSEMVIAVTHSDEINMVICQMAQNLFDVPTKVARIRSQSYLSQQSSRVFAKGNFSVDVVISPEQEIGNSILQRFETPGAILSASFGGGKLRLLGLDIGDKSPLLDSALEDLPELFASLDLSVVGIGRGDRLFAPVPSDRLAPGDRAYVIVRKEQAKRLIDAFADEVEPTRHVVVVGGGNIGMHIAQRLESQPAVKLRLIEPREAQAEHAAARLKRAIVIKGDGLNPDILGEAGADRAHFTIAVTNDDKVNLLVSSLAKNMGTKRTLALVNNPTLSDLSRDLKVDVTLDPRTLTVSQILLRLRRGRFVSLQSLEDGMGEVAEGVVLEASPLKDKLIMGNDLPEGVTIGAILRNGEPIFPGPELRVRANDHVVLFSEQGATRAVEKIFRVSPDFFG